MAACEKTGEALPERNIYFCGYECKKKDRATCPNYSHVFMGGTNCLLLRKKIDVRKILGMEKVK